MHSSVIQIQCPGLSVEEMLPHTQHCPDSPWATTADNKPADPIQGRGMGAREVVLNARERTGQPSLPLKMVTFLKPSLKYVFSMGVCVQELQNIRLLPQSQRFY